MFGKDTYVGHVDPANRKPMKDSLENALALQLHEGKKLRQVLIRSVMLEPTVAIMRFMPNKLQSVQVPGSSLGR